MLSKLLCVVSLSILLLTSCQSEVPAPTVAFIPPTVDSNPTSAPSNSTPMATLTNTVEAISTQIPATAVAQVATALMTSTDIPTLSSTSTITPEPTHTSSAVLISVSTPIPAPPPLVIKQREQTEQVIVRFNQNTTPEEQQQYIASLGATVEDELNTGEAVVLRVDPAKVDVNNLPASDVVSSSEPDYFVYSQQTTINIPPSDEFYAEQWGLQMLGVETAWQTITVGEPVVVAVVDSGVCYEHPDLSGKIIDGWDFIELDNIAQDDIGHGCGVAGIIAATTDNGIGIAGVAPNVKILPLRVLNQSGLGTVSDTAEAFRYAADHGADIINASLGTNRLSTELQLAVDYALSKGVKIVAAVGNYGNENPPLYPARFDGVIKVGAVESNGTLATYSHSGYEWLAPGSGILTTSIDNGYRTQSGTSFAAPHVSGALALQAAGGDLLTNRQQILLVAPPTITPTDIPPTITPTFTASPQAEVTEELVPSPVSGTTITATPSATANFGGGNADSGGTDPSPTATNTLATPTAITTISVTPSPTTTANFGGGNADGGGTDPSPTATSTLATPTAITTISVTPSATTDFGGGNAEGDATEPLPTTLTPPTPTITVTPSITPVRCYEDVNSDGLISILDIQMVAGNTDATNLDFDVNQDGTVNILDVQAIAGKIGQTCGA